MNRRQFLISLGIAGLGASAPALAYIPKSIQDEILKDTLELKLRESIDTPQDLIPFNVERRLRELCALSCSYIVFEPADEITRNSLVFLICSSLEDLRKRRYLQEFSTSVDSLLSNPHPEDSLIQINYTEPYLYTVQCLKTSIRESLQYLQFYNKDIDEWEYPIKLN